MFFCNDGSKMAPQALKYVIEGLRTYLSVDIFSLQVFFGQDFVCPASQ